MNPDFIIWLKEQKYDLKLTYIPTNGYKWELGIDNENGTYDWTKLLNII